MSKEHIYLGRSGEEKALSFLKGQGYKILARNYRNKFGEIDIVAKDRDTLSFIEVKTRHSDRFGLAQEAVSSAKQRQISKAALVYLKDNNLLGQKARFDVVSVNYSEDNPQLDLIKNAFELDNNFTY